MGLDPELRFRARLIPRVSFGPRVTRVLRGLNGALPAPSSSRDVAVERVAIAGAEAFVFRPTTLAAPAPALVWFHGGGFIVGTPRQDAPQAAEIARTLGIVVVVPSYRLAPDHPFPGALDDALAAFDAAHALSDVRTDRIAIGGMSAGGGLTAQLALRLRDRGGVQPVLQLLVYPMLDDRSALRTDVDQTDFRLWSVESNRFAWGAYLGVPAGDPGVPLGAVPSRASSLAGLPPAWIGVGDRDLFHDESVAYAQRLEEAGVPCALEIAAGAYHGFDEVSPNATISRRFRASQRDALRRALLA